MGIDPRKLQTFRLVVETGGISTAAKLLHLSQPAVTTQMRGLEEECGKSLLVRTHRGVAPTEWGLRLLDHAKRVQEALGDAEAALQDEQEEPEGELVLLASMTTAAYVMPTLLAGFRAVHGPVPFRLDVANTAQVIEWLVSGRAPLAMVEGHSRSPRVHLEKYLADELVPVTGTAAPWLHAVTRAADLASVPLLLREPGSGSRVIVEEALTRLLGAKRVLRGMIQLGSNQSVKMAAMAGLGIAFLSRWSVSLEVAAGRLRILSIPDLRIPRTFSWATPTPRVRGVAARFLTWARRNPPAPP